MPWSPRFDDLTPDPRLDGYRNRVGLLHRGATLAGKVLIKSDSSCQQVGGFLWWRRWSDSYEIVHVWLNLIAGDVRTDSLVGPQYIDEDVADWREGRFRYIGEALAVTWLSEAESARLAIEEFGMDGEADQGP